MDHPPDHEQLVSRFRHWLDQTHSEAAAQGVTTTADDDEDVSGNPVGLYQLIEQLTALRHDVKLATKAARGTEERNEATLLAMQAAIEQFRAVQPQETAAAEKVARPLVEALINLDESLARGRGVIESAQQRVLEEAGGELNELREQLDQLYRTQPWWRRWLCRPWHRAIRQVYSGRTLETQRDIFHSLLEGYDLIQSRLRRAMDEQSIRRTPCVGQPVDPHSMTVLEAVRDPCRGPGTVVEEIRPGYFWRGKVFRFAEVKAVGQS